MLQPHSLIWHYLWVAPNVLLLTLGFLLFRRRIYKRYPAFLTFVILGAIAQLTIYIADVSPAIDPKTWWYLFWAGLLVEGTIKFFLIGEIFEVTFQDYHSIARLSRILIRSVGVGLVLASAVLAGIAPQDGRFGIVSGAHLLEEAIYLVESGLLVFFFLFSAHFKLALSRPIYGIALGLAVSACVHLATWAILTNGGLPNSQRTILDLLNMATYHVCVLIWFYYLLVPGRVATKSIVSVPEHSLEVWNQELERLLHQ